MQFINDRELLLLLGDNTSSRETQNLTASTIRDSIYPQRLSTRHHWWYYVHSIYVYLSIKRELDLLNFSFIRLWKVAVKSIHSHGTVVNLTEFCHNTNFVFLCLCRCKKPCFQCKHVPKFWGSWRMCTGGKSELEHSVTKHDGRVTCAVSKMYAISLPVDLRE